MPTSHALSTEQVQQSTISRKRSRHSEDHRGAKRRRTNPSSSLLKPTSDEAVSQTLSKRNVRKISRSTSHGQDSIFNWMESSSVSSEHARGRRATAPKTSSKSSRSRSRNSANSVTDVTSGATSQKSQDTCSNARYRFDVLTNANLHVEILSPPESVHTQIDAIIENKILPTRKQELTRLARDFCDDFARVLRKPAGEDDCVELLYKTLSSMDYRKRLALERRARMISPTSNLDANNHADRIRLATEP